MFSEASVACPTCGLERSVGLAGAAGGVICHCCGRDLPVPPALFQGEPCEAGEFALKLLTTIAHLLEQSKHREAYLWLVQTVSMEMPCS